MRSFYLSLVLIGFTSRLVAGISGLSVSPACAGSGSSVTVAFTWTSSAWDTLHYAIAFSNNSTGDSDPTDKWVLGGASSACPGGGVSLSTGGTGVVPISQSVTVTLPSGWSGSGYVVVVAAANVGSIGCAPASGVASVAFSTVCGTNTYTPTISPSPTNSPLPSSTNTPGPSNTVSPTRTNSPSPAPTATGTPSFTVSPTPSNSPPLTSTPTPTTSPNWTATLTPALSATPTATPRMALVKSASVASASIGDTITFCLAWQNDSSAGQTMQIWDTVAATLTYLGCDHGCSQSGSLVSWSFASAANSSGSACFWAKVSGYP
jgi:hypothetical protein